MKRILAKLKSRRGASLVFALLVFTMCVLAGTAALTAASANVGRYTRIEGEQRQYFSVASALELVQGLVDDHPVTVTVKYTETTEDVGGTPITTYSIAYFNNADDTYEIAPDNLTYYQKLLVLNNVPERWWTNTSSPKPDSPSGLDKTYTITPPADYEGSLYPVTVNVKSSADGGKFDLEMYFKTEGGAYPVWPGTVTTDMTTKTEETTTAGGTTTTITTTLTCTLSWSSESSLITLEND